MTKNKKLSEDEGLLKIAIEDIKRMIDTNNRPFVKIQKILSIIESLYN